MRKRLQSEYPRQVIEPKSLEEIPRNKRLVYVLTYNNSPIVLGQGKYERAKVIFDDRDRITTHIKAIFVRVYRMYGNGSFERFVIECNSVEEAKKIEKDLHNSVGGNKLQLPSDISDAVFKGLNEESRAYMVLMMAFASSYSGISDLRRWRKRGTLDDEVWKVVEDRLKLPDPKKKAG